MPVDAKLAFRRPRKRPRRRRRDTVRHKSSQSGRTCLPMCRPRDAKRHRSSRNVRSRRPPRPRKCNLRRRPWMRWALFAAAAARPDCWSLLVRHRRPSDVDGRRLCRSRHGRHLDRRPGHRRGGRRHQQPARRAWPGSISTRSPTVPDRPRQRQGQPGADGADHRRDEAGLPAHVERCRRATGAGRARSGDL